MGKFDILLNVPEYNGIYNSCVKAENAEIPADTAINCRLALEDILKYIYVKESSTYPVGATLLAIIDSETIGTFPRSKVLLEMLHFIRKLGMKAQHEEHIKKNEAKQALSNLAVFAEYVYLKIYDPQKAAEFIPTELMSEADTRRIYIDMYLKEANWQVLDTDSTYKLADGTVRECGSVVPANACVEIPVEGMNNKSGVGFCDYVLYGKNGKPLAIVEAKAAKVDANVGAWQVKEYGECMRQKYGYVPVLYYTNGYEINVIDGLYPSRKVMGFHTMEELEYLIQRRSRGNITDLNVNDEISSRYYQKMAITNACERFNHNFRRSLIVMATGTGKTRVSISLVDVLLRNNWIKNVLFLADRTSLVEQAFKNFKKLLPEMTYCVLNDKTLADDDNARITFSTHQTMIGYIDAEDKGFSIGRYDLIIVDEAHRSIFSKYGSIFKYYDSLLVGLTATPKEDVEKNTYDLFDCENGEPNYAYSMDTAVADGFLVNYKLESKTTKLISIGGKYGDLSEEDKQKVDTIISDATDDTELSGNLFFKYLYNANTCNKVLEEVMENGLKVDFGQKIGKTIIFAYNQKHAEMIVDCFKKLYPMYGDDYCQLITNKVKHANQLITKFEEDENFRIAVSVDMLDTGIDVPSVLNLVFFKPIKSKIKFVQMIGRGTRLCPNLINGEDKTMFLIFDFCGNFEYFDQHPEGFEANSGKSLTQRLFDVRLDILQTLQSYEHQVNESHKAYYDLLKPMLYAYVKDLKENNSNKLSVRDEMAYVDKYYDYEQWSVITPIDKVEINQHITKLLPNEIGEISRSLSFDIRMLYVELSLLSNGTTEGAVSSINKIRKTANLLLNNAASLDEVKEKGPILQKLADKDFWDKPTIDSLEEYREEIRDLMKYVVSGPGPVDIDLEDEVVSTEYSGNGMIDVRTYKEKVIDYLAEHIDSEVIHKIKSMEPLNIKDMDELHRILCEELGTEDDYKKITDKENLAVFIRSLVGIDQNAVNEKFGEFLNDNVLNSMQQEFVKTIIDYARTNGDIIPEDIINKAPFTGYNIVSLFGNNIAIVSKVINAIHDCIVAA